MRRKVRRILCIPMLCAVVAGPARSLPAQQADKCLGPCDVVASKDGKSLLVLCADARLVAEVGEDGNVTRRIDIPAVPTGLVLSPEGRSLYVTCAAPQGSVCVVDVASGRVTATIPAGHGATGPAVSPGGRRLYVCNRFAGDVSVIDLAAKRELMRVPAVREPICSAITPDGKLLVVANHLPADRANQQGVAAASTEVTLIDTPTNRPSAIRLPTGSSSVRGTCVSPDGRHAFVVHVLSHSHLPTIQVERGWMNANAMSIIDLGARKLVNTVLLDGPGRGAANPWGVAVTGDGKWISVSHAGTHELTVIDAAGLLEKLKGMPLEGHSNAFMFGEPFYYSTSRTYVAADIANDPTFLDGLRRRIKLEGKGPRGVAVAGSRVYVAEYFSDTLAAVDLRPEGGNTVTSLALSPEPTLTPRRKGQIYFSDATLCFQGWQSCESCHPDARADGLNWDLLNDGAGNPKNTKSLLFAHKTPPAMFSGARPTAESAVRSGIMHIQFAACDEEVAAAIDEYLKSLEPLPSPHLVGGRLSEAAERGRQLFFSREVGCGECHPAPLYTDMRMHDVHSRSASDCRADFDTPTLIEVWRTAPYLHDGRYKTMRDVMVEGRHGLEPGRIDKLDEKQIDDLVEFVLSL